MANFKDSIRDLLNGASSGVASNFTGPVDMAESLVNLGRAGYGYLGHKAGVLSVGQMPDMIHGSPGTTEWSNRHLGVPQAGAGALNIVGQGLGMASPFVLASKAGQLASTALKGAANLAAPQTLSKEAGVFGGMKSRTANLPALERAQAMLEAGEDPATVWRQEGWGKNAEGKFVYEIPDNNARFNTSADITRNTDDKKLAIKEQLKMSRDLNAALEQQPDLFEKLLRQATSKNREEAMRKTAEVNRVFGADSNPYLGNFAPLAYENPEMYAAYPDLQKIILRQGQDAGPHALGSYQHSDTGSSSMNVYKASLDSAIMPPRRIVAHEMQHAIDRQQGFANGTSPGDFNGGQARLNRPLTDAMDANPMDFKSNDPKSRELARRMQDPFSAYERTAGEANARLVESRLDLTPEQGRAQYPFDPDYFKKQTGVDIHDLIGDDGMANTPGQYAEGGTVSNPKLKDNGYAVKQEGAFHRVSSALAREVGAREKGIREESQAAPAGLPRGSDAQHQEGQNDALSSAHEYAQRVLGRPYAPLTNSDASLLKQAPIGRVHALAATDHPEYKQAIYDAYKSSMPTEVGDAHDYDSLRHRAYRQLAHETGEQFKSLPVNMSFHRNGEGNYTSSKEMLHDMRHNKHMYVYQGGDRHDFLHEVDPETGLNTNEKFRAVHDYYGHGIHGNQFGPKGEEKAWASHSGMFTPLARMAMTAETRGQNSLVNYSPLNAKLKAEYAKQDEAAHAHRKSGDTAGEALAMANKAEIMSHFQFAPQNAVLLPPEFLHGDYAGGIPKYLKHLIKPKHGTSSELTHFSHTPNLTHTDPEKYGTGIKGAEAARIMDDPSAVRDRTYMYAGSPNSGEPGLGVHRYKAHSDGLYDMNADPENFKHLSLESHRVPMSASANKGVTYPMQAVTDMERLASEYGYSGVLNNKLTKPTAALFHSTPVSRYKEGGQVKTTEQMKRELASKPSKASEVLGKHEGKYLMVTQADRSKVGDDLKGGVGFSGIQHDDPAYKNVSWGVNAPSTANGMITANKRVPEGQAVWSTFVGSPTMHVSGQQVYDKLLRSFNKSVKGGFMTPELEAKYNAALQTSQTLVTDPKTKIKSMKNVFSPEDVIHDAKSLGTTFDRRRALADIMGGNRVGGKKGMIPEYDNIVRGTTDPALHDANVHDVGPRLWTMDGQTSYQPALNKSFPHVLHGEDLNQTMGMIPRDLALRDFAAKVKEKTGKPIGHMNMIRGHAPMQHLSEDFLNHLRVNGYADGGAVSQDDMQAALAMQKGLYGTIDKAASGSKRGKGTGAEFMAEAMKHPSAAREMQARGMQDIAGMPQMTREEFMKHLADHPEPKLSLNEHDNREFEKYQLPGGKNYRELLMTLDNHKGEDYFSGHYPEVANILAHMRVSDRTGANGEKILHLEELQSDWHQTGRKEGYTNAETHKAGKDAKRNLDTITAKRKEHKELMQLMEQRIATPHPRRLHPDMQQEDRDSYVHHRDSYLDMLPAQMKAQSHFDSLPGNNPKSVPDAPFKSNWHELALRQLMKHAVDGGYDRVGVTNGDDQAARWEGEDGLKQHYDTKIPSALNKIGKRHSSAVNPLEISARNPSAQVTAADLSNAAGFGHMDPVDAMNAVMGLSGADRHAAMEKAQQNLPMKRHTLHSLDITPAMRESIKAEGLPKYADGGAINLKNVGAIEAPDMDSKEFVLPPSGVGGIEKPPQPQQPQAAGGQQPPAEPVQAPTAAPQSIAAPAPQSPPSNILQLTKPGQELNAMSSPTKPLMAKGGLIKKSATISASKDHMQLELLGKKKPSKAKR